MKIYSCLAAFAAACLFSPAQAADCKPLSSFGTVPLTETEGDPRELIPVEIAGAKKLMMLDTGAALSTMSRATADELHLDAHGTDVRLYDLTGAGTSRASTVALKIGNLQFPNAELMLTNSSLDPSNPNLAGLLGENFYKAFDLSIDFGAHTLNLLSQDHCEGQVVYWSERPVAMIPFTFRDGDEIAFYVKLDGEDILAQLDTGASNSVLEEPTAKAVFGLVLGSADTPANGNLNSDKEITMWTHRFKSLSLGRIEVTNPEVDIIPDKTSNELNPWSTGTKADNPNLTVKMPSMLIGMNVLKHLHVYIAYKEKKLYITPAGSPAASASSSPAAPSAPAPAAQ